jgi:hypothetical protein
MLKTETIYLSKEKQGYYKNLLKDENLIFREFKSNRSYMYRMKKFYCSGGWEERLLA